jgi:hypothetical protein
MTHVKGTGQLQHHFWGTYHASIAIQTANKPSADDAAKALGDGWKAVENGKVTGVIFHGKDPELDAALNKLEEFGVQRKLVTSCAKSIDFGEKFSVTIPVIPAEQKGLGLSQTCKIQWIDNQGNATPDNNPAVGMAVVEFFDREGKPSHKREFPICQDHLGRMPGHSCLRRDGTKLSQWTFQAE